MNIAIIDGDCILWTNDRRLSLAEEIARNATGMPTKPLKAAKLYPTLSELRSIRNNGEDIYPTEEANYTRETVKQYNDMYWSVYFTPALLWLDEPLAEAKEHINALEQRGFQVWILTSNTEATQTTRQDWLLRHGWSRFTDRLITKPVSEKYTFTAEWKKKTILDLINKLQPQETIVVDDEPRNLAAFQNLPIQAFSSWHELRGSL